MPEDEKQELRHYALSAAYIYQKNIEEQRPESSENRGFLGSKNHTEFLPCEPLPGRQVEWHFSHLSKHSWPLPVAQPLLRR